jgi:hypothetical protein
MTPWVLALPEGQALVRPIASERNGPALETPRGRDSRRSRGCDHVPKLVANRRVERWGYGSATPGSCLQLCGPCLASRGNQVSALRCSPTLEGRPRAAFWGVAQLATRPQELSRMSSPHPTSPQGLRTMTESARKEPIDWTASKATIAIGCPCAPFGAPFGRRLGFTIQDLTPLLFR